MDNTAIQEFYCECYAEIVFMVANKGISAIRDSLNTVPGGLFCSKVFKTDNVFNFNFNGIKVEAVRVSADRVDVVINDWTARISEAEQLVNKLMQRNAFPDSEKMMTVEFIRNWYKTMDALPRNNNMSEILSFMMLFLEDADEED